MAARHERQRLDRSEIDLARRLLGAKTEQETVERALELLPAEEPVFRAHRRARGVSGFVDAYARS